MQVHTFLMFEGRAEEAMNLYVSIFPDAEIRSIVRYGENDPQPGAVQVAVFALAGQELMCIDSSVKHAFTFTPATSLFVTCDTPAQVDEIFARLSEGGTVLMPLDTYPFSQRFAWLNDRFGVSWQLSVPLS